MNRLSSDDITELKYFWRLGAKNHDLAKAYGVSRGTITNHTTSYENHRLIQFCKNKHDTFLCGRELDGGCKSCTKLSNAVYQRTHKDEIQTQKFGYYRRKKDETRNYHLKRNYGISLADKINLSTLQKDLCAVCGYKFESVHTTHVDHSHLTKRVRGLLCSPCNTSLGLLQEDTIRIHKLASYIEKYL